MFYMIVTEENGNYVPVLDHEDCPETAEGLKEIKALRDEKYEGCLILKCHLIDENDPTSVDALVEKYDSKGDAWGEHPHFTRQDWEEDVSQDNITQSYWGWVSTMIQFSISDIDNIPAEELPLHMDDGDLHLECPELREYFNKRLAEQKED